MKPNELRLGNLFYPIDRSGPVHLPVEIPFKVFSIGFDVKAFKFDENPTQLKEIPNFRFKDLSEIPITEKWLLDFGFEKEKSEFYDNVYLLQQEKYIIRRVNYGNSINEDFGWSLEFSDEKNWINIKRLYFVHDLQNAWFSLIEKELKFSAEVVA